jgi:CBS domain-containing protein
MALVQHILEDARKRLAVLGRDAPITAAAAILTNPNTPLVVVCDSEGVVVGVMSKSNIVRALAAAHGNAAKLKIGDVMTSLFLSCHVDHTLQRVWDTMKARAVRSVPVIDDSGRPQGLVHARDLVNALLKEVDEEEVLLRDYVLGVGYQ